MEPDRETLIRAFLVVIALMIIVGSAILYIVIGLYP